MQGAETRWYQNLFAAVFVVVFGFLFVTVAGRISGLLGNSSNPISGMSIATLMATCAIFFVAGWTAPNYSVLALMIGGVVCIAAAIAGATSQDLKTGYPCRRHALLAADGPSRRRHHFHRRHRRHAQHHEQGPGKILPTQIPVNMQSLPTGVKVERDNFAFKGKNYKLINSLGSHEIPDGEYLYSDSTHQIEFQWAQGIGSDKAPAPQARLMATVISGILNQRLPWRLVLMGVALVIAVEILGVRSLAFATGSYLSVATTAAMFAGGLVRWAVEASMKEKNKHRKRGESRGALFQRLDRRRRNLRTARNYHQSFAGPGNRQSRSALGLCRPASTLAAGSFLVRPEIAWLAGHQQSLRLDHVPASCRLPLPFRPQKAGLIRLLARPSHDKAQTGIGEPTGVCLFALELERGRQVL